MNQSTDIILTNSYIPYRPRLYLHDEKDLQTRFLQSHYNKIFSDPDFYFERVKITNFALINHECTGGDLEYDRPYYETLFKRKIDDDLINRLHRDLFVSAARRSECEDVRLEKDLQSDHFKATNLKEWLKQKGIYLSSMQKRKKCTDHCKFVPF